MLNHNKNKDKEIWHTYREYAIKKCMLNVLFMGTPDFAMESLKSLYEAKYNIIGVVTNPDKPKGRGMKLTYSPVKEYAIQNNLRVFQPIKIRKNEEFITEIKELNPDIICVVAYGKILPKEILEIPKYGCINVHASLLPKYRGAAPIQWAIINGDNKTGVTTMFMDEGMDTGDMILKREVSIGDEETTGELWDRLSLIGGELLVQTLENIEKGNVTREKQTGDYTMAPMLNKEMAKIDWEKQSAQDIKNLVRGLNPIMGAYTFLEDEKKLKFWKVDVLDKQKLLSDYPELGEYSYKLDELDAGTIIISDSKRDLVIKAKDQFIKVIEIQGENSKRMGVQEFLRGKPLDIGTILR